MAVELDHFIVSARDQRASAELLAGLLGVPWSATGVGPFSPVYLNDGLTLDFIDDAAATLPVEHYCFRGRRRRVRRDAAPHRGRRHPLSQHGPRARRHAGRQRARRPQRVLERPRRPPVGDADGELRASAAACARGALGPPSTVGGSRGDRQRRRRRHPLRQQRCRRRPLHPRLRRAARGRPRATTTLPRAGSCSGTPTTTPTAASCSSRSRRGRSSSRSRCPATTSAPERFVCFRFDGRQGLYIHPDVWHEGVFAVAGTQRFFDKQGAVHARVSVDFAREFACLRRGADLTAPAPRPAG